MHILILDDQAERHEIFQKIYHNHDVVSVFKYSEFVEQLGERRWDLIHLDHDLGDFVSNPDTWVDGWGCIREFTGCEAAKRVCELNVEQQPNRVIVHSINPVGARTMLQMLDRASIPTTWEPFGEVEL